MNKKTRTSGVASVPKNKTTARFSQPKKAAKLTVGKAASAQRTRSVKRSLSVSSALADATDMLHGYADAGRQWRELSMEEKAPLSEEKKDAVVVSTPPVPTLSISTEPTGGPVPVPPPSKPPHNDVIYHYPAEGYSPEPSDPIEYASKQHNIRDIRAIPLDQFDSYGYGYYVLAVMGLISALHTMIHPIGLLWIGLMLTYSVICWLVSHVCIDHRWAVRKCSFNVIDRAKLLDLSDRALKNVSIKNVRRNQMTAVIEWFMFPHTARFAYSPLYYIYLQHPNYSETRLFSLQTTVVRLEPPCIRIWMRSSAFSGRASVLIEHEQYTETLLRQFGGMTSKKIEEMMLILSGRCTFASVPPCLTSSVQEGSARVALALNSLRDCRSQTETLGNAGIKLKSLFIMLLLLLVGTVAVYMPWSQWGCMALDFFSQIIKCWHSLWALFTRSGISASIFDAQPYAHIASPIFEEIFKELLDFWHKGNSFWFVTFELCVTGSNAGCIRLIPALFHLTISRHTLTQRMLLHCLYNVVAGSVGDCHAACGFETFFIAIVLWLFSWALRSPAMASTNRTKVAFGYRISDRVIKTPVRPHTCTIKPRPSMNDAVERRVMQVCIGPSICGLALPMVDKNDPHTALAGCCHRFAGNPPQSDPRWIIELEDFVEDLVKQFTPLDLDADVSLETWLAGTDYSESRKLEIRTAWIDANEACNQLKHRKMKGFIKWETYLSFKHARAIKSRSDVFKAATGPFFKLIERVVFSHPAFIKHVPVKDRPSYISKLFSNTHGPYYETDYTAFESLLSPEIMLAIEMKLYRHMLQNFPQVYELIEESLTGKNVIEFRHFVIEVIGKRMSGEMCTSLGNGFTNWVLGQFVAMKNGGTWLGVVEGDDALFYTNVVVSAADFERLGFIIKMVVVNDLFDASFCGLSLSRDLISLCDVRKKLLSFGWSHSRMMYGGPKIRRSLLKAKAMSLLYEQPRCPVVSNLAYRTIQLLDADEYRFEQDSYMHRYQMEVVSNLGWAFAEYRKGKTLQCRLDLERLHDVPLAWQYDMERFIDHWSGGDIYAPVFRLLFEGIAWTDVHTYSGKYVFYEDQSVPLRGWPHF